MSYATTTENIARIEAFLQSENYVEGLRIYHLLFGETVLYRMMLRSQTSYNERKLSEALTAERDRLKTEFTETIKAEPNNVADLRRSAGSLMDERTALKAQIRMLTNKEQRKEKAFRVLEISDELDKLYGQIEFFEKNKMIWQAPTEAEDDDAIIRRYLNLRTYITKGQKAYNETLLHDKKIKLAGKLMVWMAEKIQLELTDAIKKHLGYVV